MNKLERIDYPLKQQPNGDYLWLNLFRINSQIKGPSVHIQANVHGAELQGNAVIYELINWFLNNPFKGSVTFIPFANPAAVNQKSGMYTLGRFNPVTGKNWNRNYTDLMNSKVSLSEFSLESFVKENLESKEEDVRDKFKEILFMLCNKIEKQNSNRAHQDEDGDFNLLLQKVASPADIVLDLHTGPIATRYLYALEHQLKSALKFNFPHILKIPAEFDGAMDEASFMPWVSLSDEFKKQGRDFPNHFESYTLELGSEERVSFSEAQKDAKNILHYLGFKKIHDEKIKVEATPLIKTCLLKDYKSYFAPRGALYDFLKSPGESFKKGEALARSINFKPVKDATSLSEATSDVLAIEDGTVINHATSASLAAGHPLFQVMENVSIEK